MIAAAVGVIVVFVLGAVFVLRRSSAHGARPVGAFRRSSSGSAVPLVMSDYGSNTAGDRDADSGGPADGGMDADSSDGGGDSGADSGGADGGGGGE